MRVAIYECCKCNAFFKAWGPHCSQCGLVPLDEHTCDDCPGWPDAWVLDVQEPFEFEPIEAS